MKVTVKPGATIITKNGKALYAKWANGQLTHNGRRISRAEAKRLQKETT